MKLQVLYDRDAIKEELHNGWGLSFVLDGHILFDTGEKFEYIEENARMMGIDLTRIDTVVLSHEHWDHVNGLWGILALKPGVKVYGCASFDDEFLAKVKEAGGIFEAVEARTDIAPGVSLMGGNRVMYKGAGLSEQIMAVDTPDGFSLICGCCHPGIVNMVHKAMSLFGKKVKTVIGGLHMIDKDQRFVKYMITEMKMFVEKVFTSHCTGCDGHKLLEEVYGDAAIPLKVGMEIEI